MENIFSSTRSCWPTMHTSRKVTKFSMKKKTTQIFFELQFNLKWNPFRAQIFEIPIVWNISENLATFEIRSEKSQYTTLAHDSPSIWVSSNFHHFSMVQTFRFLLRFGPLFNITTLMIQKLILPNILMQTIYSNKQSIIYIAVNRIHSHLTLPKPNESLVFEMVFSDEKMTYDGFHSRQKEKCGKMKIQTGKQFT